MLTPIGRLAFPNLFKPRAAVAGAEPRYSTILLLDEDAQKSDEFKALKQAVFECIEDEWGAAKAKDSTFVKSLRLPFRDAGEKSYEGFEKGMVFIAPWTKSQPGIVDAQVQDIINPERVWAGQLARLDVNAFAYNQSGNKGVSLGLNHVQITNEDQPRFDGRKQASDVFGAIGGAASAPDADDDLPF